MQDTLRDFGAQVRVRREEEGWTQEKLADMVGISRTYLSQIEQGRATNLSLRLAQQLCEKLDMASPASLEPPVRIDPALRALAEEERLSDKQVRMLASVEMRGKRPTTKEQWRLLYNLIKTTLDSYD